jgi:hypothetical protein
METRTPCVLNYRSVLTVTVYDFALFWDSTQSRAVVFYRRFG